MDKKLIDWTKPLKTWGQFISARHLGTLEGVVLLTHVVALKTSTGSEYVWHLDRYGACSLGDVRVSNAPEVLELFRCTFINHKAPIAKPFTRYFDSVEEAHRSLYFVNDTVLEDCVPVEFEI